MEKGTKEAGVSWVDGRVVKKCLFECEGSRVETQARRVVGCGNFSIRGALPTKTKCNRELLGRHPRVEC